MSSERPSKESPSNESLPPELAEFAQLLTSLAPVPSSVDRERLMYLAGRASVTLPSSTSGRLPVWTWPLTTAAMMLLAFWLGGQWSDKSVALVPPEQAAPQPAPQLPTHVEPESEPPVPSMPPVPARGAYLELRQLVLRQGVEALPPISGTRQAEGERGDAPRQTLLDELLGS